MNINEAFPTKYVGAADLQGRQVRVTIDRVEMETVGEDMKPVIYFRGKSKTMVCNKTNASRITEVLGSPDTREWEGKEIWLHTERVDFQGKRTDAVRVMDRPPATNPGPAPVPQHAPAQNPGAGSWAAPPAQPQQQVARPHMSEMAGAGHGDMNDEIPF